MLQQFSTSHCSMVTQNRTSHFHASCTQRVLHQRKLLGISILLHTRSQNLQLKTECSFTLQHIWYWMQSTVDHSWALSYKSLRLHPGGTGVTRKLATALVQFHRNERTSVKQTDPECNKTTKTLTYLNDFLAWVDARLPERWHGWEGAFENAALTDLSPIRLTFQLDGWTRGTPSTRHITFRAWYLSSFLGYFQAIWCHRPVSSIFKIKTCYMGGWPRYLSTQVRAISLCIRSLTLLGWSGASESQHGRFPQISVDLFGFVGNRAREILHQGYFFRLFIHFQYLFLSLLALLMLLFSTSRVF